ncbi:response regulator transcription factor [Streptomyces sp. NPDC002920]
MTIPVPLIPPVSPALPPRLLVVDDEEGIRAMLTMALEFMGFAVTSVATGRRALEFLSTVNCDLVLLDVNLPDLDGFHVCRTARERGFAMPVMFLTGRDDVDDRVHGLDLGGDDFLTKPFELKEVAARVRALLRRTRDLPAEQRKLQAGAIHLDTYTYQVQVGGRQVSLTTTEFTLLRYLMENPGRVLTRAQIQERVWNHRTEGSGTVDTYVYYLRRKLGDSRQELIRTVRGVGYLLCAE